jgi:hypothetical protein
MFQINNQLYTQPKQIKRKLRRDDVRNYTYMIKHGQENHGENNLKHKIGNNTLALQYRPNNQLKFKRVQMKKNIHRRKYIKSGWYHVYKNMHVGSQY